MQWPTSAVCATVLIIVVAACAATQNVFALATTNFMLALKGTADVVVRVSFDSRSFKKSLLAPIADAQLRVVVALAYAPDLADVALAACDAGMTARGWAWLALDTLSTAIACTTDSALSGCVSMQSASLSGALVGWLFFEPLAQPSALFFERVRNATADHFAMVSEVPILSMSTYAANLYDAILLYAHALSAVLLRGQSATNGSAVVSAMRQISFVGESGNVRLTQSGDMLQSYALKNVGCALPTAPLSVSVVGTYSQSEQRFIALDGVRWCWPGNTSAIPTDNAEQTLPIAYIKVPIPYSQYAVRKRETLICNFVVGSMMELMQARYSTGRCAHSLCAAECRVPTSLDQISVTCFAACCDLAGSSMCVTSLLRLQTAGRFAPVSASGRWTRPLPRVCCHSRLR